MGQKLLFLSFTLVHLSLTAGVFSQTETETRNELDYGYPPKEEEEEAAEEHVEEGGEEEEAEEPVEEGEEEEGAEEHIEEGEAEEHVEEEQPLKPQLIPQGSGGSGVLMGPDTQKGLKKHKKLDLYLNRMLTIIKSALLLACGCKSSYNTKNTTYVSSKLIMIPSLIACHPFTS